jgi:hypothetical protein
LRRWITWLPVASKSLAFGSYQKAALPEQGGFFLQCIRPFPSTKQVFQSRQGFLSALLIGLGGFGTSPLPLEVVLG